MIDQFSLSGKIALITGASSGFGAHFARVLSKAGASVVLTARRLDRLEALASEIEATGGKALPLAMDVTDTANVETAFSQARDRIGVPEIIINNSGLSREDWLMKMNEADWDLVMETNLKGVWRVAKAAGAALVAAGKPGSIINIASITALRLSPTIGAYAVSKAAVDHLTRALSIEYVRYGIRVNAIAPGYFKTDINAGFFETSQGEAMARRIPMRRTGELEELSGPLLLLASDAGAYMTGATLVVDGGHTQAAL